MEKTGLFLVIAFFFIYLQKILIISDMEENDITMLNHSKMNVVKMGKNMGVFSVFAVLFLVMIVLGGLFLLYYSNTLPEDMPHYIDNLLAMIGIAAILVAAAIIPAIVMMRRAVHIAQDLKISTDTMPIRAFIRANSDLWHYLSILLVVLFVLAILFALVLFIYLLPTLSTL